MNIIYKNVGKSRIDSQVAAVVSSGYADSPVVADYRTYGFTASLNKPYQLEALKNCIEKVTRNVCTEL